MLTTNSCCCCISLRTGCLIIGWLQFIPQLIQLILTVLAGAFDGLADAVPFWGAVAAEGFLLIVVGSLLYGVLKNRRGWVRFYVYVEAFMLVIVVVALVAVFVIAIIAIDYDENEEGEDDTPILLVVGVLTVPAVISVGFAVYLWTVVNSYSIEMKTLPVK